MYRIAKLSAIALATLMAGAPAFAQQYRYDGDRYDDRYYDDTRYQGRYDDDYDYRYPSRDVQYDWGDVIDVRPIVSSDFQPSS